MSKIIRTVKIVISTYTPTLFQLANIQFDNTHVDNCSMFINLNI